MCDTEKRQVGKELDGIKIKPQMVEAGKRILIELMQDDSDLAYVAERVFEEMQTAHLDRHA